MATNWIIVCILVTVISQAQTQRSLNHIIFKYLNITTKAPTTTDGLDVEGRAPRPGVVFPSRNGFFLDYLMNLNSYFQRNGWGGKSNRVGNSGSIPRTSAQTTSAGALEERRTNQIQDTTTTTSAAPTSRRDPTTTLPKNKPDVDKDRQTGFSPTDFWLKNIMRPPRLQQNWGRSTSTERPPNNPPMNVMPRHHRSEFEDTPTTTTPAQTRSNSGWTNEDADKNNGGAYIVNFSPTESPTSGVTKVNWKEPTHVEVQDKPFFGTSLELLFGNNLTSESEQGSSTEQHPDRDEGNNRHRRAASPDALNGTACDDTARFEQCQYYPKCFAEIDSKCKSRDSFIGDEVGRFCVNTRDTTLTNHSTQLRSYMKKVEKCVSDELSRFLESPSCDDVTLCLTRALLVKNRSSCLFQEGIFCNIINDTKARPELAKIVTSSTSDVDFMSRLMVNVADLTTYCKNQGSSIFVTDITMLATDKDSPFKEKYSHTPIPGVVMKI